MMKLYLCDVNSRLVVKEKKLAFRPEPGTQRKLKDFKYLKNIPTGM
jgi:hypothetical protein